MRFLLLFLFCHVLSAQEVEWIDSDIESLTNQELRSAMKHNHTKIINTKWLPEIVPSARMIEKKLSSYVKKEDGVQKIGLILIENESVMGSITRTANGEKFVIFSTGFIDFIKSDDELGFVLGHELEHALSQIEGVADVLTYGTNGAKDQIQGLLLRRVIENEVDVKSLFRMIDNGDNPYAAYDFLDRVDKLEEGRVGGTHTKSTNRRDGIAATNTYLSRNQGVEIQARMNPDDRQTKIVDQFQKDIIENKDVQNRIAQRVEHFFQNPSSEVAQFYFNKLKKITKDSSTDEFNGAFKRDFYSQWSYLYTHYKKSKTQEELKSLQEIFFKKLSTVYDKVRVEVLGESFVPRNIKQMRSFTYLNEQDGIGYREVVDDLKNAERYQRVEYALHKEFQKEKLVWDERYAHELEFQSTKTRVENYQKAQRESSQKIKKLKKYFVEKDFEKGLKELTQEYTNLDVSNFYQDLREMGLVFNNFWDKHLLKRDEILTGTKKRFLEKWLKEAKLEDMREGIDLFNSLEPEKGFLFLERFHELSKDYYLTRGEDVLPVGSFSYLLDRDRFFFSSNGVFLKKLYQEDASRLKDFFERELNLLIDSEVKLSSQGIKSTKVVAELTLFDSLNSLPEVIRKDEEVQRVFSQAMSKFIENRVNSIENMNDLVKYLKMFEKMNNSGDLARVGEITIRNQLNRQNSLKKYKLSPDVFTAIEKKLFSYFKNLGFSMEEVKILRELIFSDNIEKRFNSEEINILIKMAKNKETKKYLFKISGDEAVHQTLFNKKLSLDDSFEAFHSLSLYYDKNYINIHITNDFQHERLNNYYQWVLENHPREFTELQFFHKQRPHLIKEAFDNFFNVSKPLFYQFYPARKKAQILTRAFYQNFGLFQDYDHYLVSQLKREMPKNKLGQLQIFMGQIDEIFNFQNEIEKATIGSVFDKKAFMELLGDDAIFKALSEDDLFKIAQVALKTKGGEIIEGQAFDNIFLHLIDYAENNSSIKSFLKDPKLVSRMKFNSTKNKLSVWQINEIFKLNEVADNLASSKSAFPLLNERRSLVRDVAQFIKKQFPEQSTLRNETLKYLEKKITTSRSESSYLKPYYRHMGNWYKDDLLVLIDSPHILFDKLKNSQQKYDAMLFMLGLREDIPGIEFNPELRRAVQILREGYWGLPLEGKTLTLLALFDEHNGILSSSEYTEELMKIVLGENYSNKQIKVSFETYLRNLPVGEQKNILSHIIGTIADDPFKKPSIASFVSALDAMGYKGAQFLRATGFLPKKAREELSFVFDRASPPEQQSFYRHLEDLLGDNIKYIHHVEGIKNAGSINYTAKVVFRDPDTNKLVETALTIQKENVSGRIQEENKVLKKTAEELMDMRDYELKKSGMIIEETRSQAYQTLHVGGDELDQTKQRSKYESALKAYENLDSEVRVKVASPLEKFQKLFKKKHQGRVSVYEWVEKIDIDDLSVNEQKKILKQIVVSEDGAQFIKGLHDTDGHPGNWLITRDIKSPSGFSIVRIDYAQMVELSAEELKQWKNLFKLLIRPKVGEGFVDEMASLLKFTFQLESLPRDYEKTLREIIFQDDFPSAREPIERLFKIQEAFLDNYKMRALRGDFKLSPVVQKQLASIGKRNIYQEKLGSALRVSSLFDFLEIDKNNYFFELFSQQALRKLEQTKSVILKCLRVRRKSII